MYRIVITIFACVFFLSCGNKQETKPLVVEIDMAEKARQDSIRLDSIRQVVQNKIEALEVQRKIRKERLREEQMWDSIIKHRTDSMRQVVKHIQRNPNISISQRIKRIQQLRWSDRMAWINLEEEGIGFDEFIGNEMALLVKDTAIINYNLDSLFQKIQIDVAHSEDYRIWAFSWRNFWGGTGNCPVNVIVWRDTNNKFQGFEFINDCFIYVREIYKLHNTSRDLYLLFGSSKGTYWGVQMIELTAQGINFDYKGFQRGSGFQSYYIMSANFDSNNKLDSYNRFDKDKQVIRFRGSDTGWWDKRSDSLTIGTLTFNGRYFTEKLKMKKIEEPNSQ